MRQFTLTAFLLAGCISDAPDLPGFTGVPIEAPSADYAPCATTREAEIRCVLDGDTVSLGRCNEEGERIRLLGIDAPEISHEGLEADCYGDAAMGMLNQLIGNEAVWLSFGSECQDLYGRTLAWIWLASEEEEPVLISEWMLRHGHARLYEGEGASKVIYRERLIAAEQSAMEGQLGLWGECGG